MASWLARIAAAVGLASPAIADPPPAPPVAAANPYPPIGMREDSCPASLAGLNAQDDRVVRSDWAWLCRYRKANAALDPAHPPRAVFMGDSITEGWIVADPQFFAQGFVDRGISGQTTPQMLVRFWADVIALKPRVVHIMGGTNDIAGNTGPTTPEAYQNNIRAMVALAKAHGIAVVLGSIPPSAHFGWSPAQPGQWISKLNAWLKDFAKAEGLVYADYHTALAGPNGELPAAVGPDGVHPNAAGYAVMRPVAEAAIAAAEKKARIRRSR